MLHFPETVNKASCVIHYAYPPALFLCFLVMQGITVCTLENLKTSKKIIRKRLLLWLQICVIITYVSSPSGQASSFCICGSRMTFMLLGLPILPIMMVFLTSSILNLYR